MKNIKENQFDAYVKALFESRKNQYDSHADVNLEINTEDFETVLNRLYQYFNLN